MLGDVNFTGMSSPQHFLYCEIDSLIRSRAIGNAMTVDKAFCEYVYQIVVLAEALETIPRMCVYSTQDESLSSMMEKAQCNQIAITWMAVTHEINTILQPQYWPRLLTD